MDVVYVPWGTGSIDEMIACGAEWLGQQLGHRLVLVMAKAVYRNNPLLPELTAGAEVATPNSLLGADWRGGPVLVPWPDEKVLTTVAERLPRRKATGVCVLPWGEDPYTRAWLEAQGATDLLSGQALGPREDLLPPVVMVAMESLCSRVNHANALTGYDRERAIGALVALVRAGYRFEVQALVAWSLGNGFTGREVERLREYATKALAGHRFRLRSLGGWRTDIVAVWEQEARTRGVEVDKPGEFTPRHDW